MKWTNSDNATKRQHYYQITSSRVEIRAPIGVLELSAAHKYNHLTLNEFFIQSFLLFDTSHV